MGSLIINGSISGLMRTSAGVFLLGVALLPQEGRPDRPMETENFKRGAYTALETPAIWFVESIKVLEEADFDKPWSPGPALPLPQSHLQPLRNV